MADRFVEVKVVVTQYRRRVSELGRRPPLVLRPPLLPDLWLPGEWRCESCCKGEDDCQCPWVDY